MILYLLIASCPIPVPTLSLSTNLLIDQYVDNTYVGGNGSPSVTCLPSDTRAPVRWRLSTGVYGDISDDYLVFLSPRSLNHTVTFPVAYEILPRKSAFYVCDLINVELPTGAEVSPQNITVRFIQSELSFHFCPLLLYYNVCMYVPVFQMHVNECDMMLHIIMHRSL